MNKLVLVFTLLPFWAMAQRHTISGVIKDQASGENLIGASVLDLKHSQGTTTNTFGFYSLTLPRDSVWLRFSYVGYQPAIIKLYLERDTTIHFELNTSMLQEVIVDGNSEDAIQNTTRMGTIDVPIDQLKKIPALLGETDVLKVIQLLPGVQAGTEGSSGLYVRGGGPDQNLLLLDGVPVYNASHLFGFISVFNADAINHVELVKGGFPARYGGRLSSVIDINMKEGNQKKFKGEGSIGFVASKLTLEGPIVKDRTSFIVSARRTYLDVLTRPMIQAASHGDAVAGYYFYDFNGKINHKINERNRLYLSTYMGNDRAYARSKEDYYSNNQHVSLEDKFGLQWGNITTALRWNSIISKKLFSNLTATYSRYRFDVFANAKDKIEEPDHPTIINYDNIDYVSGIRDYALKADFDFLPSPSHFIKFGTQAMRHRFTPGVFSYRSTQNPDTTLGSKPIYASEFFAYAEDDIQLSRRFKVNVGIHASLFNVNRRTYHSVQPRISARFLLTDDLSLKASYAKMTQYLHLLTNAGLGLPTDLWVPTTPSVGPENSYLTSAGLAYNLWNLYDFSVEAYYKTMTGLIEYKDGASYADIENDWQKKIAKGSGETYGAEFFFHKKTGKFNGWAGYTLSWNYRTFPEINDGRRYFYKYDRRHDIEFVLAYQINDMKDLSLTWVYGTGNAISLANASYWALGRNGAQPEPVDYYNGRNNYRMRAYLRLDLSYTRKKITKYGERSWSYSVYNAYSRRNPFFMDIGYDQKGHKKFIQYSLFPIIPSLAFHFKF